MDRMKVREEADIVRDLATLASKPGYAHAIAALCFRDNTVPLRDKLAPEDIAAMFSDSRLLRTEISTLIGLLVKAPIMLDLPAPSELQQMLDDSDVLLRELHDSMSVPLFDTIREAVERGAEEYMVKK